MKKIFLLAGLSLLLAGCNDKDKTTPAASVNISGNWTMSISQGTDAADTFAVIANQTNSPNSGDFNITVNSSDFNGGTLQGNIYNGSLKLTAPTGESVSCTGSFSNNYTKYSATCPTQSSFGDGIISMTKN